MNSSIKLSKRNDLSLPNWVLDKIESMSKIEREELMSKLQKVGNVVGLFN